MTLTMPQDDVAERIWTKADFDQLSEIAGGPVDVPFFGPDLPMVTLDFTGIEMLNVLGKVGNPLRKAAESVNELVEYRRRKAAEALAAADDQREWDEAENAEDDDAAERESGEPEPEKPAVDNPMDAPYEQARRLAEFHDLLGQAVWVNPPWQSLESVRREGRKPGHHSVLTLTMAQRNRLIDVVYTGVDALSSFRDQPVGPPASLPGSGLREEPERLPDSEGGESPEVLAGPSDLAASAGATRGSRRSARQRASA